MSTIDSFVSLLRIFNRNIWDKVDVPDVNEVEHSCIFWLFSVCYEYDLAGGLGCSVVPDTQRSAPQTGGAVDPVSPSPEITDDL